VATTSEFQRVDIRRFYRDYDVEQSDDENDYSTGPSVPNDAQIVKSIKEVVGLSLRVQDWVDV